MINSRVALEAVAFEQFLELAAEPVRHGKVQGTEILVEGHVRQVLSTYKT